MRKRRVIRRVTSLPILIVALCSGCGDPDQTVDSGSGGSRSSTGTERTSEPRFTIRSVFWTVSKENDEEKIVPIRDRTVLTSGAEIGWKVELNEPTHLYLVYRGPGGSASIVFPSADDPPPHEGIVDLIPAGTTLDESTGLEQFYLFASLDPVHSLEEFLDESASTDEEQAALGERLAMCVLNLRKQHEEVAGSAARPVRIGGTVRSDDRPENYAVEYGGDTMFCRKFTIDHR